MEGLLSEMVSFVLGLGAGWSLKVVVDRRAHDQSSNTVVQKHNRADGGGIAGRDINSDGRGE